MRKPTSISELTPARLFNDLRSLVIEGIEEAEKVKKVSGGDELASACDSKFRDYWHELHLPDSPLDRSKELLRLHELFANQARLLHSQNPHGEESYYLTTAEGLTLLAICHYQNIELSKIERNNCLIVFLKNELVSYRELLTLDHQKLSKQTASKSRCLVIQRKIEATQNLLNCLIQNSEEHPQKESLQAFTNLLLSPDTQKTLTATTFDSKKLATRFLVNIFFCMTYPLIIGMIISFYTKGTLQFWKNEDEKFQSQDERFQSQDERFQDKIRETLRVFNFFPEKPAEESPNRTTQNSPPLLSGETFL